MEEGEREAREAREEGGRERVSEGGRQEGREETEGKKLGREGEKREEEGRVGDYDEKGGRRGAALEFYISSAKSLSEMKLIFLKIGSLLHSPRSTYYHIFFFVFSRPRKRLTQILHVEMKSEYVL